MFSSIIALAAARRIRITCLYLLAALPFLTCCTTVFAAESKTAQAIDPQSLFEKANDLYQRGDFQTAATYYQELLRSGSDTGHMRYNLANASYRLNRFGTAILEYRRALLAMPSDPDVLANLKLAREKVQDRVEPDSGSSWYSGLLFFNQRFTARQMQIVFFLSYLLFWAAIAMAKNEKAWPALPLLRNGLGAFVLLWGILSFGVGPRRDGTPEFKILPATWSLKPSVIVSPEVKVYSGDSETFQVIAVLHDGAEVESFEQRGNWHGIILPGGRRGWVKDDGIQDV